nr:hypothetical protein [Sinomonas notoginsengisoli]
MTLDLGGGEDEVAVDGGLGAADGLEVDPSVYPGGGREDVVAVVEREHPGLGGGDHRNAIQLRRRRVS